MSNKQITKFLHEPKTNASDLARVDEERKIKSRPEDGVQTLRSAQTGQESEGWVEGWSKEWAETPSRVELGSDGVTDPAQLRGSTTDDSSLPDGFLELLMRDSEPHGGNELNKDALWTGVCDGPKPSPASTTEALKPTPLPRPPNSNAPADSVGSPRKRKERQSGAELSDWEQRKQRVGEQPSFATPTTDSRDSKDDEANLSIEERPTIPGRKISEQDTIHVVLGLPTQFGGRPKANDLVEEVMRESLAQVKSHELPKTCHAVWVLHHESVKNLKFCVKWVGNRKIKFSENWQSETLAVFDPRKSMDSIRLKTWILNYLKVMHKAKTVQHPTKSETFTCTEDTEESVSFDPSRNPVFTPGQAVPRLPRTIFATTDKQGFHAITNFDTLIYRTRETLQTARSHVELSELRHNITVLSAAWGEFQAETLSRRQQRLRQQQADEYLDLRLCTPNAEAGLSDGNEQDEREA